MRRIVLILVLISSCFYSLNVWANSLTCIDYRGYQVHWIEDSRVAMVAQAGFTFNGAPYIKFDSKALSEKDENLRRFFQIQECGRHVLGNTLSEEPSYVAVSRADCWAAVHLKINEKMSSADLSSIQAGLSQMTPAEWDQVSGPVRVINLNRCLK